MGPMTGRGAGYCAGYDTPGYMNPYGGRGWGRGGGRGWGRGGWGRRNWFAATGMPGWMRARMGMPAWGGAPYPAAPPAAWGAPPAATDEHEALKAQAESLEATLDNIRSRIDELEREKEQGD